MVLEYIEWFVNREKQFDGFKKMLAGETPKQVMIVEDKPDMGKTWLVQRLRHHCIEQKVPTLHVDFRDRLPHDYLSLVRMARDQIGAADFNDLTAAINQATTVQIGVATAESAAPGGVTISDVSASTVSVGGSIVGGSLIQDNQFYVQGDSDIARRSAEIKINDAFFACLGTVLTRGPVAFLFDSCEEMTAEATAWLQGHLLLRLKSGTLARTLVILAGQTAPPLDEATRALVAQTSLAPLEESHVREYITRRKIEGVDIATVFKMSGGNPKLLSMMADAASVKAGNDDDWL